MTGRYILGNLDVFFLFLDVFSVGLKDFFGGKNGQSGCFVHTYQYLSFDFFLLTYILGQIYFLGETVATMVVFAKRKKTTYCLSIRSREAMITSSQTHRENHF